MKLIRNLVISKKKKHILSLTFFALFLLLMSMVCFQYYNLLQKTITNESSGYLQEISKQISNNVSRTIDDNFAVLNTIYSVLKNNDVKSYSEIQPVILEQQKNWNYKRVLLIDGKGNAYNAYGDSVKLASSQYIRELIVDRKHILSSSELVEGSECILFAIPIEEMTIGNVKITALAATYDVTTFDQILSMSAFDDKGYAHIVKKDGSTVIFSSSSEAYRTGFNAIKTLSSAIMDPGCEMEDVKKDLEDGKSGMIGMTFENMHLYMAYVPVEESEWRLLSFVPVDVVNAKSEILVKLTFLICGIIAIVFSLLFLGLVLSAYQNRKKLENIAYVDQVTGGNTIQKFNETAKDLLSNQKEFQYALIFTNIEKFKILNEQFGHEVCDEILCSIQKVIEVNLKEKECMARLSADNFCILVEYQNNAELENRIIGWYEGVLKKQQELNSILLSPMIGMGIYVIVDNTLQIPNIIDRAKLALKEPSYAVYGKLKYTIYNDKMRYQMYREKYLEDRMEDALNNGEFVVYLQPKYITDSEKIGGAEALVRWITNEGIIFPDEFITLFEKNGFIVCLDQKILEEVCIILQRWHKEGRELIKISVNASCVNLNNPLYVQNCLDICNRYNVSPKYIEIEVTESMFFEGVERLTEVIHEIHAAGFGCSMDDFGSGYSSLNLIQNIPVDTIKMDKVFFRNTVKDYSRTESVVGTIIAMSKSLDMITVAEGVEKIDQVEMLKRLGCDYIQGYYFAKPMPVEDFEKLTFGSNI